jgi:hypothetical protein
MFVHANKSWKRYNLSEIIYFINLGLKGIFGNFAGLSMATFCQFETNYQKHENNYYRKEYLRLNPLPELVAVQQHTESGKDEIVADSIISRLRSKKATNGDYVVWFSYLQEKGLVNDKSWIKFVIDEVNKSEPAKERYKSELLKRKTICMSLVQEHLVLEINKELEAIEKDNPKFAEIEYWAKVLFFENTFCTDENINKLETFLKNK